MTTELGARYKPTAIEHRMNNSQVSSLQIVCALCEKYSYSVVNDWQCVAFGSQRLLMPTFVYLAVTYSMLEDSTAGELRICKQPSLSNSASTYSSARCAWSL